MSTASLLQLRGDERIVFTKHADERLQERSGVADLDFASDEILAAFRAGRVAHVAANIVYAEDEAADRVYRIARRGARLVVVTVVTPHVCRGCGGGGETRGLRCPGCGGSGVERTILD